MKKVSSELSKTIRPVKIYLDEVNEIYDVLHELSSDVKIIASDYEFTNIAELAELKSDSIKVCEFKITATDISGDEIDQLRKEKRFDEALEAISRRTYRYVTVRIGGLFGQVRIYADPDDLISHGVVSKIESVLLNCQRYPAFVLDHKRIGLGLALIGLLLYVMLQFDEVTPIIQANVTILAILWIVQMVTMFLGAIWIILIISYSIGGDSTIFLRRRAEDQSFFKRNKDQIILVTISAILGGIATLLIQVLIGN